MHHGLAVRHFRAMVMGGLLLLLVPGPGSAESPSSPGEEVSLGGESEKVRANQERTLRDSRNRIAEIYAGEGRADEDSRAEKITRDRISVAKAALKGGSRGQALAQMAETAGPDARSAELYRAQAEYLASATVEWTDGAERKQLDEAASAMERNMASTRSHLAKAAEAANAISAQLRQSGVLEKMAQIETVVKDAGERLRARWERERAARVREREQREREAGERAREQRR